MDLNFLEGIARLLTFYNGLMLGGHNFLNSLERKLHNMNQRLSGRESL